MWFLVTLLVLSIIGALILFKVLKFLYKEYCMWASDRARSEDIKDFISILLWFLGVDILIFMVSLALTLTLIFQ